MSQDAVSGAREKPHSILLRKGSSSRIALKEKVVQIYEAFFQGDDPSQGNPNFWDEFFLLRVNMTFIETEIEKLSGEGLMNLKDNFNMMFCKAVEMLKQDNPIRVVNALHTLCAFIHGIYRKSLGNYGFDVINLLIGFDAAETVMQSLIESLNGFLLGDCVPGLKQLALKFILVLITAADNISQNTLLEYLCITSVFESITQILGTPALRQTLGHDAVLVLSLLVQYRKYESANPYIFKLSILDDELALTGCAQVVSAVLCDFNSIADKPMGEQADLLKTIGFLQKLQIFPFQKDKQNAQAVKRLMRIDHFGDYQAQFAEQQTGWFSALANMVGNMFVAEEKRAESVRANDSLLLALYEAIHLNRNFITALTHSHTPSAPTTPPSSPTTTTSPVLQPQEEGEMGAVPAGEATVASQPTNLLVTFLEYSSIIMQDTKDSTRYNNAKLCLIILTCIAEDQYANSLMHDANMTFRVQLHRMPMRHRKVKVDKNPSSRPLVCALIDLMVEFTMSHMMKTFPLELYLRCLGIIHRVLCYQKKLRVRIQYPWKELWTALINLIKFILSHETQLLKKHNIFHLASKVVNIFNLFITYGDTFLPNPNSYDELYYEVVRMHQVFDNLYSMALRYTTTEGEFKDSAAKLTNHLNNIRAIVNHFTPKVDTWAAANGLSSLTEDQVLEVVRGNYDTLTLKLQDNLDQFERYSEKPKEAPFFTQLVRSITSDVRRSLAALPAMNQQILHELSAAVP